MKLLDSKSIAGKLTRLNIRVSGTALLLAYVAFVAYHVFTLRQDLVGSLKSEAGIVGANTVTALTFDDPDAAQNTLSGLRQISQIRWALVLRPNGSRFVQYTRDSSIKPDLRHTLKPGETIQSWTDDGGILLGSLIVFGGKTLGAVYLSAETTSIKRSAGQFGILSALILLLCFFIALQVTAATRSMVSGPLSNLAETAQVVTRNEDYSVRAEMPGTSDELSFLVQSFNNMLDRIQQRDQALEESRNLLEQRVEERTAELSAANKELDAFSYSVAHDLRGPLQHMTNFAFLIQTSIADNPRPEIRELFDKLFEGTRRMSGIIEDLLNLSRATSAPLHRTAIDLSSMSGNVLSSLQAGEPGRKVKYTVSSCPPAIADEGLMQVVLENLLGNAWKYTSKISTAEIEFGCRENSAHPIYFVRDNGAGFNLPSSSDRLFRPFQRLHSQSEFPGTGIGLATAYRIIERHGGRLWAESEVDKGATFLFTLPGDTKE